jgi:hypothetical protein
VATSNVLLRAADESVVNSSLDQNTQPAVLNVPSVDSHGQKQTMPCLIHGMEGERLTLEAQERPPISAAVSIECNDALFLGEVIRSAPEDNGYWRAEIKVEQILTGLQSLMNLRARLLDAGVGPSVGRTTAGVCA